MPPLTAVKNWIQPIIGAKGAIFSPSAKKLIKKLSEAKRKRDLARADIKTAGKKLFLPR